MSEVLQGSNNESTTVLGTATGSFSGRPESEYKHLNKGFGETNKLYSSGIANSHYTKNRFTPYFQSLKKTTQALYDKSRLDKTGPWYGVVLSVTSNRKIKHPGSNQDTSVTPVYRVRIPELHAHLPFPTTYYGDPCKIESHSGFDALNDPRINRSTYDEMVVGLYPEFRYMKSGDTIQAYAPKAGDIVWVDFLDKETQETGILLQPAQEPKTNINTKKIYSKSSTPFNPSAAVQTTAGAAAASGSPIDGTGGETSEQQQVPKFTNSNSPFLQTNGANFFSSDGGILIQEKTTLGGLGSKVINENGDISNKKSGILNMGINKIPTNVDIIDMTQDYLSNSINSSYFSTRNFIYLKTNRVRVYSYGTMNRYSQNLVISPSVKKAIKLHILAARRLEAMNYSFIRYINIGGYIGQENITGVFKLSRGVEYNKYGDNYEKYEDHLINKYGSFDIGRKYEKFHNSYETGLVFDIGNNGLKEYGKDSIAFEFLVKHSWRFGIYPSAENVYKWEVQVPRENWFTGKDFVNQLGTSFSQTSSGYSNEYAVYVSERSLKTGRLTSDKYFDNNIFT
jgi:hypothetical protein